MHAESVLADYRARLQRIQADIDSARSSQSLSVVLIWSALFVGVVLFWVGSQGSGPKWLGISVFICGVTAIVRYAAIRSRWSRLQRRHDFYERGIERLEGNWHGRGCTGEAFRAVGHAYETDLQVLGSGSLFELLCTARTGIGRSRLAEYLLKSCDLTEVTARQESVRELMACSELRERVALLGKFDFQESTWEVFSEWMRLPVMATAMWVRALSLVSSFATGVAILAIFAMPVSRTKLVLALPPLLLVNLAIAGACRKRTALLDSSARQVGVEIQIAREGIQLLASQSFRSPKLRSIQEQLTEISSSALHRLERLTNALTETDKPYFYLPSRALILPTQLCFAIEHWRSTHGRSLMAWLNAWAEFEALLAISGYASENPEDLFPEFESGDAHFVAQGLGHPLIPSGTCVRNDVALDGKSRFYIVSGSNMSGKSTLLRSIGVNAVLAKAGAPVRACSLRMSNLAVFASLSIIDSILEGKSRFFAEVERVSLMLEGARLSPVLFLIDEILSGTNSRDRRVASEVIVQALLDRGAIGVLSTHDLALTEIAELAGFGGSNRHMGSRSAQNVMDFDYLLKPGVTQETNALAIVAMMGVSL